MKNETAGDALLRFISRVLRPVVCWCALKVVACAGCAVRFVEQIAEFIQKNPAGRGKMLTALVAVALLLPGTAHAGTPPVVPDGFVAYSFQDSIRERGHLLEPYFPAWMCWLDGSGDGAAATVKRTVYTA